MLPRFLPRYMFGSQKADLYRTVRYMWEPFEEMRTLWSLPLFQRYFNKKLHSHSCRANANSHREQRPPPPHEHVP
jgi:hypothetical protein